MSTTRDPNQIIKAFLEEGVNELPDRSFDAVRTAIDQTRQWAVVGPWKEPQIMTATRFALIAAAIAVFAIVAIRFLPVSNVGPAPAPSPVATPVPTPSPTPRSLLVTPNGPTPIEAGTYLVGDPFLVPLTFTVPNGWTGNIGGPNAVFLQKAVGSANVSFTVQQSLYADACHFSAGLLSPTPGPAASDLATALAAMPGLTSTTPADVSINGYSGKQVTLTAPTNTSGCDLAPDGLFRLWQLPLGATEEIGAGSTERLWVVDVGSQRLVIQTSEWPGETEADKGEANAIVGSVVLPPHS